MKTRRNLGTLSTKYSFSLLALAVGLLSGCQKQPEQETFKPKTVVIETVSAHTANEHYLFSGKLRAAERAILSFESSGTVKQLNVELGEAFKKGSVLAKLDDTRAKLNLKAAQADLLNAKVSRSDAQIELNRLLKLKPSGAVSESLIDQAQARFNSADALVSLATANVATAQKQVTDVTLKAPFDGEVVSRSVEPSHVVNAGQPILEVVGKNSGFEAVANVPTALKAALVLGTKTKVQISSTKQVMPATIIEVGNRANSAGLLPVTFALEQHLQGVSSGQSVEVYVNKTTHQTGSVTIPKTAYGLAPSGQAFVFVVKDDDTLIKHNITLGHISDSGVDITNGLKSGERIVIKGVDLLSDGQKVDPVEDTQQRFGN